MIIVDDKTFQLAKRLGYQPIKDLDKDRLYVLLAKKDSKYYVIKTNHLEDEVEILKIFNSDIFFRQNNIIIPNLYEHSNDYIVQDFISGIFFDISNKKFNSDLRLVLDKLELMAEGFKRHKNLSKYTKGWNDQYLNHNLSNSEWFQNRIKRWFSQEYSRPKYRFIPKQIVEVRKLIEQIKGKTTINYGAFSPAHIRIDKERIGIFDFGRHLRWAPKHYDRAYLWWGLLYDRDLKELSPKYWQELAVKMSSNISNNEKAYYWSCILERLAGLAKDLTQSDRAKNPKWKKTIIKIKKEMTIFAIGKLKETINQ